MAIKERHWNSLITSVRLGRCVLVLGPEIPARVDLNPSNSTEDWVTFPSALANHLRNELAQDGRTVTISTLAAVAQLYEDAEGFGPAALRSAAAQFIKSVQLPMPSEYQSLAKLPFPLIITTCQNNVFDNALREAGKETLAGRYNFRGDRRDNPELTGIGSPEVPVIYHMFGDAEEPLSLVLSENDYLDFLSAVVAERPPLPNSFKRAVQRLGQQFLFVGFGVNNWYLRVLLKVIVRSLELNRTGSTLALERLDGLSETEREQTILFYQRGTRVEVYDEDLETFLVELSRRISALGAMPDITLPVGPRPRIFVSYASEDATLALRLFSKLQTANFEPWLDTDALRGGQDWNSTIEEQIRDTDYVLVLETPALARKQAGYINKEISIAGDRAEYFRGSFLIPLLVDALGDAEQLSELKKYQSLPLRNERFDEDFATIKSTINRDFQRRQR
jgi:hypothetical protein